MCSNPRLMYRLLGGEIVSSRPIDHPGTGLVVPCSRCKTCLLRRRGQWQTRGICEMRAQARKGLESYMATFTFDEGHLPRDLSVSLRTYQLLAKRLRKRFGAGIRMQGIGEYGGQFMRPHYHFSLFGLVLDDLVAHRKDGFSSAALSEVWPYGWHDVMRATPLSIGYVAAHQLKDFSGHSTPDGRYLLVDPRTGEARERARPFRTQSNRPGIGQSWFEQHWRELLIAPVDRPDTGWVFFNQEAVQAPDYFVSLLRSKDRAAYERIKANRLAMAADEYVRSESMPDRSAVRDKVRDGRFRSVRDPRKDYSNPSSVLLVDLDEIPEGVEEFE